MRPLTQSVILMMVAVDGLDRSVVRFFIEDMAMRKLHGGN
jgi:hypothetical protein